MNIKVDLRRGVVVGSAILYFILAAAMIVGAAVIPIAVKKSPTDAFNVPATVVLLSVFGALFLLRFIYFLAILLRGRAMYLSEEGLYIYCTPCKTFVEWGDIGEISYYGPKNIVDAALDSRTTLTIRLASPNAYAKKLNPIKRLFFRLSFNRIVVRLSYYCGRAAEIAQTVNAAFEKYGKNGKEQ